MKIAIVVQGRFHGFDLARALLGRGHDVTVLTNYPRWAAARFGLPQARVRGFVLHGAASRAASRVAHVWPAAYPESSLHRAFGRWAAAEIGGESWDVVHSWSGVSEELLETRPHALTLLMRGSSHIAAQDRLLEEEAARAGRAVERPSAWMIAREMREYALADHIAVLSTFARRTFLERGVAPDKVSVLPLGVDVSAFRASRAATSARLARVRSGAPLRVLYAGALSLRKGFLDIVRLAALLRRDPVEFKLVGPVVEDVRPLLRELGPNVSVSGKVRQEDLPAEYAEADVFIFPTIEDGFGLVLAQASAAALPILATPNSAAPDLLQEGITGWVLPIRDPEAFAGQLRWCVSHRDSLASLIERLDGRFRPRDWTDVAADFEVICRRASGVALQPAIGSNDR